MEQWVVHLEGEGCLLWEHVTEGDVGVGARLHCVWTLKQNSSDEAGLFFLSWELFSKLGPDPSFPSQLTQSQEIIIKKHLSWLFNGQNSIASAITPAVCVHYPKIQVLCTQNAMLDISFQLNKGSLLGARMVEQNPHLGTKGLS